MSIISKKQFDELVQNTTKYLSEYQERLIAMETKLRDYDSRLAHMEQRKKPGPKPRAEQAA
jgi:hypothetical protein